MSKRTFRRTGIVIVSAFFVLIVGFSIAWLSGYGYLPFLPQTVVMLTIVVFCFTMMLSATTSMAGTSFIARQRIARLPDSPEDDIMSRVIRDSRSGVETILQAHPNSSIREVLEDYWPFEKKATGEWYLIDEGGNDVSNWPISNWEGIAVIHYTN